MDQALQEVGSMSTATTGAKRARAQQAVPALEAGDHLDQPTFHARYTTMPEEVKAELIGGVVFMPSPVRRDHGKYHVKVLSWLDQYADSTPGTEVLDNTTHILGKNSEPQPDACLRILEGQSKETADGYIQGASELIAEVASSTVSYDLHSKKADYERFGVREYVVFLLDERRVIWFVRNDQALVETTSDANVVFRSSLFPGLWLDAGAFFRGEFKRVREILNQGLSSSEHAKFIASMKKS
jgi:Uma2 family endonuclease